MKKGPEYLERALVDDEDVARYSSLLASPSVLVFDLTDNAVFVKPPVTYLLVSWTCSENALSS